MSIRQLSLRGAKRRGNLKNLLWFFEIPTPVCALVRNDNQLLRLLLHQVTLFSFILRGYAL